MRQMITILSSLLFLLMGFSFLIGMLNNPKSKRYKQMMTLTGIGFVLFISSVFVGQIRFTSKPKVDDNASQEVEEPESTPVDIIIEEPKVEAPVKETPVEAPKEPVVETPKEPEKPKEPVVETPKEPVKPKEPIVETPKEPENPADPVEPPKLDNTEEDKKNEEEKPPVVPDTDVKPKPETKPETKPEVKPEIKPETKPDSDKEPVTP